MTSELRADSLPPEPTGSVSVTNFKHQSVHCIGLTILLIEHPELIFKSRSIVFAAGIRTQCIRIERRSYVTLTT